MAITWTYETAFHLLLRAGFGHDGKIDRNSGEAKMVRKLADMTQVEAVDYLLDSRPTDRQGPGKTDDDDDYDNFRKLQKWWWDRLAKARRPAYEKMVFFLHQHFATARLVVNETIYMATQNALFREFAFGDFRELVKRVNIDPAMLIWLNGEQNTVTAPNENYGREVMELFTLGVFDWNGARNYSQVDVAEAAKILTGWRILEDDPHIAPEFRFTSRHHKGVKNVFAPLASETPGQNAANLHNEPANAADAVLGMSEHRRFIDAIFGNGTPGRPPHVDTEGRPTAARFIARRMWKFFAYDPDVDVSAGTGQQDKALIDAMADAFKGPNPEGQQYNLKTLLRSMMLRDEFYADTRRTVKGPVEYVIGGIRMLGAKVKPDRKLDLAGIDDPIVGGDGVTARMGQELLNPPDVFSWRGNLYWITTQTLLERYEFADELAFGESGDDIGYKIEKLLTHFGDVDQNRSVVADHLIRLLIPNPAIISVNTKNQLIAQLGAADPINLQDSGVQTNVRRTIQLILMSPQFHVH